MPFIRPQFGLDLAAHEVLRSRTTVKAPAFRPGNQRYKVSPACSLGPKCPQCRASTNIDLL